MESAHLPPFNSPRTAFNSVIVKSGLSAAVDHTVYYVIVHNPLCDPVVLLFEVYVEIQNETHW